MKTTVSVPARNTADFSIRDLCLMGMFTALMAVFSWISIPAPAPLVPFTLQTFGIFIAMDLLGGKRGTLSILCFILLAAAGAPVLSGFSGGLGVLFGSTGGYILGFLFMGAVYWMFEALLGKSQWVRIVSMLTGLLVCYAFGTIWFTVLYSRTNGAIGIGTALMWCVVPFLLPDIAKLALAVGISSAVKKRVTL